MRLQSAGNLSHKVVWQAKQQLLPESPEHYYFRRLTALSDLTIPILVYLSPPPFT